MDSATLFGSLSPRSSGDRAPPSGGGGAGSNPAGGTQNIAHSLAGRGSFIQQIAQQAQKVKSKLHDRKRHALKTGVVAASANARTEKAAVKPPPAARAPRERVRMPPILKASRQMIRPMSVADACHPAG